MRLHLVDHNCNIAIVWVNGKQNQPLSCKFQVNEGRDHVNTCDKAVKFYDIVVINIFFNAIICKIEKKKKCGRMETSVVGCAVPNLHSAPLSSLVIRPPTADCSDPPVYSNAQNHCLPTWAPFTPLWI